MAEKHDLSGCMGEDSRIMRTVYFTICEGYQMSNDGYSHPYTDTLIGKYTPSRATKFFARETPDENITITRTKIHRQLISMAFYDFWLNGIASDDPVCISEYALDRKLY